MSFLKKLFGGGGGEKTEAGDRVLDQDTYKEFTIRAIEMKVGGEFQLCGEVVMATDDGEKVHRFVRADRLNSADQASEFALSKARQIVDEQGKRLFA